MPKSTVNIAVVGATGAVGKVFIELMKERDFPSDEIRLLASKRSEGKVLTVNGQELAVSTTTKDSFKNIDIAFISASADVSRQFAPIAVENGAIVVDDSSAFRLNKNVPLVIPEVNANDLLSHEGITAIPNCSTIQMAIVLKPLHDINPIKRVIVDTYQAVSGTGIAAISELYNQSKDFINSDNISPEIYPHQIAFNLLPHIEPFLDTGYTNEENKMIEETRKILHEPEMLISATCVRVPVFYGHSEAIHIEFENPFLPEDARKILNDFPGISVIDDPKNNQYPMPIHSANKNDVFVGRIRKDLSCDNGLALWIVSDNLRKGAALNAMQIAEHMIKMGLIK